MTTNQTNHPFYGHYTGQPALAGTSSSELEDFVGAQFYCPHALVDGNQRIGLGRIRRSSLQQCYLHCLRTEYDRGSQMTRTFLSYRRLTYFFVRFLWTLRGG